MPICLGLQYEFFFSIVALGRSAEYIEIEQMFAKKHNAQI